ncbi:MAG: ParA family protein [Betaproteobacteria bacterium]|nr:MAG: ParA family protein [Betaproteobacteria bacterium]TMH43461.1 MAG: ParA family protein [Betaproteobacteria bacterium]
MKTTLVVNPKGGAGKTTVAINLASYFAAEQIPVTLMDYDPQGSSLHWLRLRPPQAAKIHGANAAPEKYGRLRSFDMYVPPQTRHVIIDAPAGSAGVLLQEMLVRSSTVLVPLVPSIIDLHATGNFLRELTAMGPVKYGHVRMAVIANKVRRSMPAYAPLQSVLDSLGLKLLTRLIDSDVFLKAAESGTGIFELNPGLVAAERKQFMPIVEWVTGLPGLAEAAQEAARVCDLARTRAA